MSPTITPDLQAFIQQAIASGKYRSEAEVVSEGLRLLQEKERKLDALRQDLQVGLDQLENGEGIVLADDQARQEFFQDIETRGRERLRAKRNENG
jgi:antitoxin ParD1/3/4